MTTWRRDPQSVLDYAFDWTDWVAAGEQIDTATVAITAGPIDDDDPLTVDSVTHTDSVVTAWVSGGVPGDKNQLTSHIETDQGRTDERTVNVHTLQR